MGICLIIQPPLHKYGEVFFCITSLVFDQAEEVILAGLGELATGGEEVAEVVGFEQRFVEAVPE